MCVVLPLDLPRILPADSGQQLQYNLSMFICLSWIVPSFLYIYIGVAIITQQYLSFQRILKRSVFDSHSFCIENIVDLIILDLPMKLPKAGKLFLSIFSAAILCIDVHLSFLNCPFLSFQYWRCNHDSTISFISEDLETECVRLSFFLYWKHRRSNHPRPADEVAKSW